MRLIGAALFVLVGVVLFNLTVAAAGFWESLGAWTFVIAMATIIFVVIHLIP